MILSLCGSRSGLLLVGLALCWHGGCNRPEPDGVDAGRGSTGPVKILAAAPSDLAALPAPAGAKLLIGTGDVVMFVTEQPADAAKTECKKRLVEQGWEPYGEAADALFFKREKMLLTANITAAPAQGGKTVVSYTRRPVAVDLPAPPDALDVRYADATKTLTFDAAARDPVWDFYRKRLTEAGWEPTTQEPIRIGSEETLLFRNPQKDLLTLALKPTGGDPLGGKWAVTLRHESAEQLAAAEKRAREAAERKRAEQEKPPAKFALAVPADARVISQDKSKLELQLTVGLAKPVVEAWAEQWKSDGWQETVVSTDAASGGRFYKQEGRTISVIYTDPQVVPSKIIVTAIGAELEIKP